MTRNGCCRILLVGVDSVKTFKVSKTLKVIRTYGTDLWNTSGRFFICLRQLMELASDLLRLRAFWFLPRATGLFQYPALPGA